MPGSPFDLLESTMFDVVTSQMGYDASWTPSTGLPVLTGRVLFGSPSNKHKIILGDAIGAEYLPEKWFMEYKKGVFDGLKQLVDDNNDETVVINGTQFFVRQVATKYDGDTYVALLAPITTE